MPRRPESCRSIGAPALILKMVDGAALMQSSPAAVESATDLAQRRIAAGEGPTLTLGYAEGAVLEWAGGQLDGTYQGPAAIEPVWTRFAQSQGQLEISISEMIESSNPCGQTVMASEAFANRAKVKMRYLFVLRDRRVANELRQIDPALVL